MQLEHPQRTFDPAGEIQRVMDAFGGDARDADELLVQISFASSVFVPARLPTAITNDRFSRCICRQTSSAMRTSAECEKAPKSKSDTSGPE